MNTETIRSRVICTGEINWKQLKFIQDEDFKEWMDGGDEKLMQSIVKFQFIDPFKVWEHDGELYCLDGKHRWLDLMKLEEKGVLIPDLLPATFINCTDIKEAAELVLVYSSAYARITAEGAFSFIKNFDIDFEGLKEFVEFPNLDINILNDRFLELPSEEELVGLTKNKNLTLTITAKSKSDMDDIEQKVKSILEGIEGTYYSVSGGEL